MGLGNLFITSRRSKIPFKSVIEENSTEEAIRVNPTETVTKMVMMRPSTKERQPVCQMRLKAFSITRKIHEPAHKNIKRQVTTTPEETFVTASIFFSTKV